MYLTVSNAQVQDWVVPLVKSSHKCGDGKGWAVMQERSPDNPGSRDSSRTNSVSYNQSPGESFPYRACLLWLSDLSQGLLTKQHNWIGFPLTWYCQLMTSKVKVLHMFESKSCLSHSICFWDQNVFVCFIIIGLCILDINPLLIFSELFENIFSFFVGCLFIVLLFSLLCWDFLV